MITKMFTPQKVLLFLLLSSLSFSSCQKKWKQTTKVNFEFQSDDNSGSTNPFDFLKFNAGHITVSEISFSGDRKQGADVQFTDNFSGGKEMQLSATPTGASVLSYDIPQGIYTNINIKITAKNDVHAPIIKLAGAYTNGIFFTPVIFEFDATEIFNIKAQAQDGSNEIVLVEDKPCSVKVVFDMDYTFGILTQNILNAAVTTLVNNIPTIVINSRNNQSIFDLVSKRVQLSARAVFKN